MEIIFFLNSVIMTKRKYFLWLNIPKRRRFVVKSQNTRTVIDVHQTFVAVCKKSPQQQLTPDSNGKIEGKKILCTVYTSENSTYNIRNIYKRVIQK